MKKYNRKFKESTFERKTSLISFSDEGVFVQSPFNLNFEQRYRIPGSIDLYDDNKELYTKLKNKAKEINEEINDVREILYNYILSKVAELQKMAVEEKSDKV